MARKKTSKKKISGAAAVVLGIIVLILGTLEHFGVIDLNDTKADVVLSGKGATVSDDSVSFIDVGQGNSALAISSGHAMLIDGGETDKGKNVLAFLEKNGVKKLDYVIATHQHTDHIGGLVDVLQSDIEIGTVIMPKIPDDLIPTSYTYENFLNAISDRGLKIHAARDEELKLGNFTVNTFAMSGDYSNLNNYSVVTKISSEAGSFLIMGDLETTAEKELLSKSSDLSADVLYVGHHGSSSSSGSALLDAVDPSCAVISVGEGNKYGHPNEPALKRIREHTDKILRTDLNGNIVFDCTKQNLSVSFDKGS